MSSAKRRLGTELPKDFPTLASGEPYPSGTAYEVLSAIEARKADIDRGDAELSQQQALLQQRLHARMRGEALWQVELQAHPLSLRGDGDGREEY